MWINIIFFNSRVSYKGVRQKLDVLSTSRILSRAYFFKFLSGIGFDLRFFELIQNKKTNFSCYLSLTDQNKNFFLISLHILGLEIFSISTWPLKLTKVDRLMWLGKKRSPFLWKNSTKILRFPTNANFRQLAQTKSWKDTNEDISRKNSSFSTFCKNNNESWT